MKTKLLIALLVLGLSWEVGAYRRDDILVVLKGSADGTVCGSTNMLCGSTTNCIFHMGFLNQADADNDDFTKIVCRQILIPGRTEYGTTIPSTFVPLGLEQDVGSKGYLYVASNETTDKIYIFDRKGKLDSTQNLNNTSGNPLGLTTGNNSAQVIVALNATGGTYSFEAFTINNDGSLTYDTTMSRSTTTCGSSNKAMSAAVATSSGKIFLLDDDGDLDVWTNTTTYSTTVGACTLGGGANIGTSAKDVKETLSNVIVAFDDNTFNSNKVVGGNTYNMVSRVRGDLTGSTIGTDKTGGFYSVKDGLGLDQDGNLVCIFNADGSEIDMTVACVDLDAFPNATPTNNYGSGGRFIERIRSTSVTAVFMSSFTGHQLGRDVFLKWTTNIESQNLGFNILRRDDGKDCYSYMNDKLIPAVPNPGHENYYTYVDQRPEPGKYSYLIENVDYYGNLGYDGDVDVDVVKTRKGLDILTDTQWWIGAPRVKICPRNYFVWDLKNIHFPTWKDLKISDWLFAKR